MTHDDDRLHELLALELYGELDEPEARELAGLEGADRARARALRAELSLGLGALEGEPLDPELPSHVSVAWREALLASTRPEPARGFRARWLAVAASFAAGLVVGASAWHAAPAAPPSAPPTEIARASDDLARFATDSPPPRATGGGSLARLGAYVR
jgi:hypothetical protein